LLLRLKSWRGGLQQQLLLLNHHHQLLQPLLHPIRHSQQLQQTQAQARQQVSSRLLRQPSSQLTGPSKL
jgi:hypothetical protein